MTMSQPAAPDVSRVITGLTEEITRLRTGRRREVTVLLLALLGIVTLTLSVIGHPEFGPAALVVLGLMLVTELVLLEVRVLRVNRRISDKRRALAHATELAQVATSR